MKIRSACEVLVIPVLLVFGSCRDHGTNPSIANPEGPHIKGGVVNWLMGDTMVAVAAYQRSPYTAAESIYVFGTSAIGDDGTFSLPLSSPPQEVLSAISDRNLTFSDTAAKFVMVYGLALRNPDNSYSEKVLMNGTVPIEILYSDSSQPGDYLAYAVYADRDVEMTGNGRSNVVSGQTIYFEYQLTYKKGWNRVVETVVSNQAKRIRVLATVVNGDGGNWYVE